MDITPSPEFCAACRIVLGGDTPDIVLPALQTSLAARIGELQDEIVKGKRVIDFPLVPPAGTLAPLHHMLASIQDAAGTAEDDSEPPAPPTEGAGIKCVVCGARPYPELSATPVRQDFDLVKLTDKGLPAGQGETGEWRCSKHFKSLGGDRYQLVGG
jgi:hypothetical protein